VRKVTTAWEHARDWPASRDGVGTAGGAAGGENLGENAAREGRCFQPMSRRVACWFFALAIGLSFGWVLRGQESVGSIAEVYYWKAKPGKLDDSNRYIQTVAEPVDFEARRAGAFPFHHHLRLSQARFSGCPCGSLF